MAVVASCNVQTSLKDGKLHLSQLKHVYWVQSSLWKKQHSISPKKKNQRVLQQGRTFTPLASHNYWEAPRNSVAFCGQWCHTSINRHRAYFKQPCWHQRFLLFFPYYTGGSLEWSTGISTQNSWLVAPRVTVSVTGKRTRRAFPLVVHVCHTAS